MRTHSCYRAVQRPVLFGGVSMKVIALELLFGVVLVKAVGFEQWWLALILLSLPHQFLSWLLRRDHQVLQKLPVYLRQPDRLLPGRTRRLPPGFGGMI